MVNSTSHTSTIYPYKERWGDEPRLKFVHKRSIEANVHDSITTTLRRKTPWNLSYKELKSNNYYAWFPANERKVESLPFGRKKLQNLWGLIATRIHNESPPKYAHIQEKSPNVCFFRLKRIRSSGPEETRFKVCVIEINYDPSRSSPIRSAPVFPHSAISI